MRKMIGDSIINNEKYLTPELKTFYQDDLEKLDDLDEGIYEISIEINENSEIQTIYSKRNLDKSIDNINGFVSAETNYTEMETLFNAFKTEYANS